MAFHLIHRYGDMEPGEPGSDFLALLCELKIRLEDTEHDSVAVTHDSEWCLSASRGGYLIFENLETGGEQHMEAVPTNKILELWRHLAQGNLEQIQKEPWLPGY
ncbi:MAG: hypothetical protein J0H72_05175 [Burkholderiales bacterium]|nr:hypothetical protein [Burkholderiales bacterium]